MKKIFFFFVTIFSFVSSFSQDVILIEGKQNRVDAVASTANGYLGAQGKTANVRKSYNLGFNDPSGTGTTDGTWIKISHPATGTTRFVQMSQSMTHKIVGIINDPTSDIAAGNVIDQFCIVQATSLKEVLDLIAKPVANNDCGCKTEVIVRIVEVPVTPARVELGDFVAPNQCELATMEFAKLEALYNYADKAVIQKNGFKNKKAVERAMVDMAIQNPICLSGKLHKNKNNDWVYWTAAGVGVVLLADIIEGDGVDFFGIGNSPNPKKIIHTEPTSSNSGGVIHTEEKIFGKL